MSKIKNLFKNKKTRIITIVVVVIIVILLVVTLIFTRRNKSISTQDFSYTRTVTLSKGTLNETVVADGTIESQTTSTISLSGVNANVAKINYAVGDYVKEGDVVIELDTSSISKQIAKAQESIADQKEQLEDNFSDAYDAYYDAYSSYNSASASLDSASTSYNKAKAEVASCQEAYDTAVADLENYVAQEMSEGKTFDGVKAQGDYTTKNGAVNAAKANLEEIKKITNYDELEKQYQSAKSNFTNAVNTLNQKGSSYDAASERLDEGVDSDNLNDLYDNLSDYKLKAKSTGQVTSINAVVGSNASGTLATIQDTSKLKISLSIDEYDILKLKLGMKAIIETDASDKSYDGEVSMISPVASSSMGSSGFEIEVKVTSEDVSDLLIGMNAEVTIILSSGDENYSVPVDAVETKDDGTSIIYVQDGEDFKEVKVTLGNSNGYYIEIISDELKDGMKVRASADADEANVNIDTEDFQDMNNGFNLFGGGNMQSGGSMPSGGGNMPSGGMPSGGPGGF